MVTSTVVCGIFLFAVRTGVFRRRAIPAYWAGFAVAGIGYLVLVPWVLEDSENDGSGRLATTKLLRHFEPLAQREVTHEPNAMDVTRVDYCDFLDAEGILVRVVAVPHHDTLVHSGQLPWGLLIGYGSGLLAR
jgi:hypothetical protein